MERSGGVGEMEGERRAGTEESRVTVGRATDRPVRIAIVDDDDGVRRVLRRVLERDHMEVVEFADGKSIATGAADFDLVCLDLSLGGVSGLDVLKHLKAETPDVPVIMVTGNSDVDTVVAVMRAGADEYVTKPVDRDSLVSLIRRLLPQGRTR